MAGFYTQEFVMKSQRNILIAFLLNLSFSIFELIGSVWTGSVAIASDAIHDFGDAISIGIAWWLERKSQQPPNEKYTYGYARLSVIGGLITTTILCISSMVVIFNAIQRLHNPTQFILDFCKNTYWYELRQFPLYFTIRTKEISAVSAIFGCK